MALQPDEYNITPVRKAIHDELVKKVFKDRGGGNFTSLKGYDIEAAFDLYDEKVFGGQIRKKLSEEGSLLRFFAKSRSSGVGGICGIRSPAATPGSKPGVGRTGLEFGEVCEYYIDVAPNILARLTRARGEELGSLAGVGCADRVYCFQLVLEHEIVHLLMILWGYLFKEPTGPRAHIFTKHGDLFQCLLRAYFGHTEYAHDLGLVDLDLPETRIPYRTPAFPTGKVRPGLMVNWSGSCYMDSMIMALFLMANNYYRQRIFEVDPADIDYTAWTADDLGKKLADRGEKVYKMPCRPGSRIQTESETRAYTGRLQAALREDYDRVAEGKEIFKCTNLRGVFAQCMPRLLPFGDFNVSEVYDILTDIFPALKLHDIPAIIANPTLHTTREGSIESKTMFQMWDYMDPGDETEGAMPKWDEVDAPMLVFQNGLVPPIRDYGSTNPEKITVHGPIPGKYTYTTRVVDGTPTRVPVPKFGRYTTTQKKARAFGEYIIGGRYRLVAAVSVQGFRPRSIAEWGGGHYVAYLRPKGDPEKWYHYNDLGPVWRLMTKDGSLDRRIFVDGSVERPELLFYERIASPGEEGGIAEGRSPPASPPPQEKTVEWNGISLHAKLIYRPDGHVLAFIRDASPGGNFIGRLTTLTPEYTTKVTEETYMWRELPEVAEKLLAEVQEIDRTAAGTPSPGAPPPGTYTNIDAVPMGKKFRDLTSELAIYNYSNVGFVVWGEKEALEDPEIARSLKKIGGIHPLRLKYGLNGGYVFSKKKHLKEVFKSDLTRRR